MHSSPVVRSGFPTCLSPAGAWKQRQAILRSAYKLCTLSSTSEQQSGPDISQLSPLMQRQWHVERNAHLGDIVIKPSSARKVWWTCDQCPHGHTHQWEARDSSRRAGRGCPFCANRAVCQHNSLATKGPAIAAQFSHKNTGSPHDYTSASNQKVTWQCQHGHEWDATIYNRTNGKTGCPVCFGIQCALQPRKRHPVLTDSQHPMMQYWDWELNAIAGLEPSKITCRSQKIANWICPCCPKQQPHSWQATVGHLYCGSGCPFCSGHKACMCNSLQSLFPKMATEWDYNRNKGTPDDYAARSSAKVWWYNNRRGHFQSIIKDRTRVWPDHGANAG